MNFANHFFIFEPDSAKLNLNAMSKDVRFFNQCNVFIDNFFFLSDISLIMKQNSKLIFPEVT